MNDENYIKEALLEAQKAHDADEVPIGAVIVHRKTGEIIARGHNLTRAMSDPSAHAEMIAIRNACKIAGAQRIPECDLYVTLEPCTMCAAAISFARIGTVYFGASDPKGGGIHHGAKFYDQPTCHHRPNVMSGILEAQCGVILRDFFKMKRETS